MNAMKRPNTRAEFERNFHLLHAAVVNERMSFAEGIGTEGLARVRFLPNGRIDFLSVDESARLLANTMSQFSEEDLKEAIKEQQAGAEKGEQSPAKADE